MIITYNDWAFNDDIEDTNGAVWYVTALSGWDGPTTKPVQADPATRHGGVLARNLLGTRAMVMEGVVKSPNLDAHWDSWAYFDIVFGNLYVPVWMTVQEGSSEKSLRAVRVGDIRKNLLGQCAFGFSVNLSALDPLKYDDPHSTNINDGASAEVVNVGSWESEWFTITTTSAGTLKVANTDFSPSGIVSDGNVPVGTVVDVKERTVQVGGSNQYNLLTAYSAWFPLLTGSNTIVNSGTADITLTHRSAWL